MSPSGAPAATTSTTSSGAPGPAASGRLSWSSHSAERKRATLTVLPAPAGLAQHAGVVVGRRAPLVLAARRGPAEAQVQLYGRLVGEGGGQRAADVGDPHAAVRGHFLGCRPRPGPAPPWPAHGGLQHRSQKGDRKSTRL